jgi:hypothetical protein
LQNSDRTIQKKDKGPALSNLESAIESLEASVTPVKSAKHSYHLGPWRTSKKKIHKSEDLKRVEEHFAKTRRTPLWENKAMKHVVKKVHTWLFHADNQVYNVYASVEAVRCSQQDELAIENNSHEVAKPMEVDEDLDFSIN